LFTLAKIGLYTVKAVSTPLGGGGGGAGGGGGGGGGSGSTG